MQYVYSYISGAPVGMWTWGLVHTNPPYLNQGGQIMPTLYWCPHQVLKATGATAESKISGNHSCINFEMGIQNGFEPIFDSLPALEL